LKHLFLRNHSETFFVAWAAVDRSDGDDL
jgi:hypothetical protein